MLENLRKPVWNHVFHNRTFLKSINFWKWHSDFVLFFSCQERNESAVERNTQLVSIFFFELNWTFFFVWVFDWFIDWLFVCLCFQLFSFLPLNSFQGLVLRVWKKRRVLSDQLLVSLFFFEFLVFEMKLICVDVLYV